MANIDKHSAVYCGTAAYFDTRLGRKLSPAPEHLSRVLYIPRHNGSTTHLPVYEVEDSYRRATGDVPLGSSLYATQLGMMQKPLGDNLYDNVAYLADIHRAQNGSFQINLTRRALGSEACEVKLAMPSSLAVSSPACIEYDGVVMGIDSSFPIPPSIRGNERINHPYVTFTYATRDPSKAVELQWQIHPVSDGPLRYTLVQENEKPPNTVRAIYHHLGWAPNLSLEYSEGVLLLPEPAQDEVMEPIVVVSLLGMLAQLRKPDSNKRLQGTGSKILHAVTRLHHRHK